VYTACVLKGRLTLFNKLLYIYIYECVRAHACSACVLEMNLSPPLFSEKTML
jgi:hypothetical protein